MLKRIRLLLRSPLSCFFGMADGSDAAHSDNDFIASDDDDEQDRTIFRAESCPVGGCSHQGWKRARCYSYTSIERCICKVARHLMNSASENHGMSQEEAEQLAASAVIKDSIETYAERKKYRHQLKMIEAQKLKQAAGKKGGGKGKDKGKCKSDVGRKRDREETDEEEDPPERYAKKTFNLLRSTVETVCANARELQSLKDQLHDRAELPIPGPSRMMALGDGGSSSHDGFSDVVEIPRAVLPQIVDQITRTQHAMKSAANICAETTQRLATEIQVLQRTKEQVKDLLG